MKLSLLKQRNFTLVILGKFVSLIGTILQEFVLSLYVLKTTGSGTQFAFVLTLALIPKLLLGPIAGVIVDWLDRKKIVVLLDLFSGLTVGAFCTLFIINGRLDMYQIYILVIALSVISTLFNPAISTMIPSIMKKEELADANSFNSFVQSVAMIIGPILGGVLYATVGLLIILIINSVSFVLSAISEMFIQLPKQEKSNESKKHFFKDFKEGIIFIKDSKELLTLMVFAVLANLALGPMFSIGMPIIMINILKISELQFGIMESILCAGMLLGSIFAGKIIKKYSYKTLLFTISIFFGVLMAIIALIVSPIVLFTLINGNTAYVCLIIVELFIVGLVAILNIMLVTEMQKLIPNHMLGRVIAVHSTIGSAAVPLGQMVFGTMFDISPAYINSMILAGIMVLAGVAYKGLNRNQKNIALEVEESV